MAWRGTAVGAALWVLGASLVVASTRAASVAPVQGDDLLTLFVLEPDGRNPWSAGWTRFWAQFNAWRTGGTDHFSPLGSAFDIFIKRSMGEAPLGLSMHQVHQVVFVSAALLAFVAAVLLVCGAASAGPASSWAVPVGLGFAAAAQVTTVWSTYDPLVVHPAYGTWVTTVGLWFLVAVQGVMAQPQRRRWRVAACPGEVGARTGRGTVGDHPGGEPPDE